MNGRDWLTERVLHHLRRGPKTSRELAFRIAEENGCLHVSAHRVGKVLGILQTRGVVTRKRVYMRRERVVFWTLSKNGGRR